MDSKRIEQLREAAAAADVSALVLRLPENVLLATRYWPQLVGLGIAVIPLDRDPVLVVPDYEQSEARAVWPGDVRVLPVVRLDGESTGDAIERHLRDIGAELDGGPIGFEGSYEVLAPPAFLGETFAIAGPTQALWERGLGASGLVDVTAAIEAIKVVKSDHDIERLKVTNAVAAKGMDAFKRAATPGRSEIEVAVAVETAIAEVTGRPEARVGRGFATVTSGRAADVGWQYFRSSDRRLEDGDWVLLELGTVVDGYWSDHTRTVVAGTASDEQRAMFAAGRAACDAALAACVPGATGGAVDDAARAACSQAGFEQFPHHTGHGLGFRYHESSPALVPGSSDELVEGMVVAVEPGIYGEGRGGMRWEDDAVVTEDGAELLGGSEYGVD